MPQPGQELGRYRLLEQIGQGGMSVVYRGLDTGLDREVAVKVLHPHLAGKQDARQRLAREARAVAKLHHPNILEVYDFSCVESGDAFIVCEHIRGQTLRQFLAEQPFDPPEIAAMVIHEIASALAHAHDEGVIHRDLKPENVMVRHDGVLKLMDFGIAKVLDRDEKMTLTGALVGSPAHMAPEVIEGEEAGPEADVFSLGTMLYLFATSRLPFTAPNTTATLKKILDGNYDDPRLSTPRLSDGLSAIIAKCLAKAPSDRYPDARRLQEALAAYLAEVGVERVSEETISFFVDPPSYRKLLTERLCVHLLGRAERDRAEGKSARALGAINQVLALDGQNATALALLDAMNSSSRRKRWGRLAGGAVLGLALLALATAGVRRYRAQMPPEPRLVMRSNAPRTVPETTPELKTPIAATADAGETPSEPSGAASLPGATAEATTEPATAVEPSTSAAAKPVDVEINIRPWGYLRVDGGPRSDKALPIHRRKLVPGRHKFTITCDEFCTEENATYLREVSASGPNVLNLTVQLKPSSIVFSGFPPEATVLIAQVPRGSVEESQKKGIRIAGPPARARMEHTIEYEIRAPGFLPEKGQATVEPGRVVPIHGQLREAR